MSAPLKTVILGGTGFLGQRICRYAAMHGSVLSLSRRAPATPPPTSTRFPIQHVPFDVNDYVQGQGENVQLRQEPSDELREHLKDCTVAVHALGTVMDSDAYKLIVKASSASEMLQNAQRLVASASPAGSRGLYELLNRDGATAFALLCARFMPNLKHFVYVSTADQLLPVPFQCAIDRRYWTTKRHAETILTRDRLPGNISMTFQRSIVRPGFMYADGHPITMPLSAVFSTMRSVKLSLPVALQQVLPRPPAQSLHVDSVAQAITQLSRLPRQEDVVTYEVDALQRILDQ